MASNILRIFNTQFLKSSPKRTIKRLLMQENNIGNQCFAQRLLATTTIEGGQTHLDVPFLQVRSTEYTVY